MSIRLFLRSPSAELACRGEQRFHRRQPFFLNVVYRMVGGEVALSTANPKLDVKVSLHPAFQCMVIGY